MASYCGKEKRKNIKRGEQKRICSSVLILSSAVFEQDPSKHRASMTPGIPTPPPLHQKGGGWSILLSA